jgi:hypothetical protein
MRKEVKRDVCSDAEKELELTERMNASRDGGCGNAQNKRLLFFVCAISMEVGKKGCKKDYVC